MTELLTTQTAAKLFRFLSEFSQKRNSERILSLLQNNDITLSEAIRTDPYYLASIHKTIDAITRASCHEKVVVLRELFIQAESTGFIAKEPDLYQEMLSIISELSYREILILRYLEEGGLLQSDHPKALNPTPNEEVGNLAAHIFFNAKEHCANKLKLNQGSLDALMVRLLRTGLLTSSQTWESHIYFFSPLYRDLRGFITYGYYE